jgi:ComF family protein
MRLLSSLNSCLLCGANSPGNLALCTPCQAELPCIHSACLRCALALGPQSPTQRLCGQCSVDAPPFERCYPLGDYSFPLREMIARLKFHGRFSIGRVLGQLLALRLAPIFGATPPDLLLPVPLHTGRLRWRGFNQSIEITKQLSRHLGIPSAPRYCQRTRASKPQRGLSAAARKQNVQGIFRIAPEAIKTTPRHIVIVDDVVTTMATVKAIAYLLKKEGVERVDVACLARVS